MQVYMSCIAFKKLRCEGTKINQYLNGLELCPVSITKKAIYSTFIGLLVSVFEPSY